MPRCCQELEAFFLLSSLYVILTGVSNTHFAANVILYKELVVWWGDKKGNELLRDTVRHTQSLHQTVGCHGRVSRERVTSRNEGGWEKTFRVRACMESRRWPSSSLGPAVYLLCVLGRVS